MKLVTFTRDMRPYNAKHDYALPDAVADAMIEAGHAKISAKHEQSGLAADARAGAPPRQSYLTRRRG